MQVQFVDNTKIDAYTRKQIRSQVMLGKNTGKQRKQITVGRKKLAVLTAKNSKSSDTNLSLEDIFDYHYHGLPQHWDEISTFSYPGELEPYERQILKSFLVTASDLLYPRELCFDVTSSHRVFFELFQSDESFFHCLLAIAEGTRYIAVGRVGNMSNLGVQYLTNTYRAINNDLRKNDVPRLGTVAAVMSLTMHENLFGMTGKSKVHLDALVKMVELRGGLEAFEPYSALLHKVCRSDLEFALQVGTRPRFNRDIFPRDEVNTALAGSTWPGTPSVRIQDNTIRQVFDDCMDVARVLNHDGTSHKLNPFSFQEVLISTGTRLLHAYPLNSASPANHIDSTCYLALLALVTTMLIRGGQHHREYYHLLADKLRVAIKELETNNIQFKFWVCYVATLSVLSDEKDWIWLAPMIRSFAAKLGIDTCADARVVLMNFPWVRFFHDEPGSQVFIGMHISKRQQLWEPRPTDAA